MTIQPVAAGWSEEELAEHHETVVMHLRRGRVTPILGAGASLYGRPRRSEDGPADAGLEPGDTHATDRAPPPWAGAPSASELAALLATEFKARTATDDLLRVAQWIYALRGGSGGLYEALHEIFDHDFPPTELHTFLADVPSVLRQEGRRRAPLIVTTNYDDLVESALRVRGEPHDRLVYMAEGENEGRFVHIAPDGKSTVIREPEEYLAVDPDRRTVVLKMHGYVCRDDPSADSYVITEDHYIEYLSRTDLTRLLPKPVMARLLDSHLLFLGYSLRDWNFRVILYYLHNHRLHDNDWWAVQLNPDPVERKSWERRNVGIVDMPLERYIPALAAAFGGATGVSVGNR